jgi:hypothetical protein
VEVPVVLGMLAVAFAWAVDANDKPAVVLLETWIGTPTGLYGLRAGMNLAPRAAVDLGVGTGGLGLKGTAAFRFFSSDHDWEKGVFSGAVGPVVALWSEGLGFQMPAAAEPDELLYSVWVDASAAWEVRLKVGFTFRVSLGLAVHVTDNQAGLCDGVPQGRDQPSNLCNPPHWPTGPMLATAPVLPNFGLSYGWAF